LSTNNKQLAYEQGTEWIGALINISSHSGENVTEIRIMDTKKHKFISYPQIFLVLWILLHNIAFKCKLIHYILQILPISVT
jgi:hypothetical protein